MPADAPKVVVQDVPWRDVLRGLWSVIKSRVKRNKDKARVLVRLHWVPRVSLRALKKDDPTPGQGWLVVLHTFPVCGSQIWAWCVSLQPKTQQCTPPILDEDALKDAFLAPERDVCKAMCRGPLGTYPAPPHDMLNALRQARRVVLNEDQWCQLNMPC